LAEKSFRDSSLFFFTSGFKINVGGFLRIAVKQFPIGDGKFHHIDHSPVPLFSEVKPPGATAADDDVAVRAKQRFGL
jgi:hypothetical protein